MVPDKQTGKYNPGSYVYSFNAADYASGVYFYRWVTDEFIQSKKMVILK